MRTVTFALFPQGVQLIARLDSTSGLDGLAEALSKEQKPGTMVWSKLSGLRMIRDTSGMSAVADVINKNLAMAEVRKVALLK